MTIFTVIEWNDSMCTGVDEVDRQHRILVDTLNQAATKLTGEVAEALFEQITRDLLAYAIYHFDTEEQLMQRYRYAEARPDEAASHLHQHRSFSEKVVQLREQAREGDEGARNALLDFLQSWLVNHILTTDKRLGGFVSTARHGT